MQDYQVESFVGSGFGGTVHAAVKKLTGDRVIVKKVLRSVENAYSLDSEIQCARVLKHKNIITTNEIIDMNTSVCFIQEFADGGDLYEFIQVEGSSASENQLKEVFGQIVSGVEYIHAMGYVHRDIKPENVVLFNEDDGSRVAKLIDFGLAESNSRVQCRVGTDAYCAPEVSTIKHNMSVDGKAADIFSLGVLLHSLIVGHLCWNESSINDSEFCAFVKAREAGQPGAVFGYDPEEMGITAHLTALIDSMLDMDPSRRPTASQVKQSLSLPWYGDFVKEQADFYRYKINNCDSGCWADEDEEDMDFTSDPVPDFSSTRASKAVLDKCDSGVAI